MNTPTFPRVDTLTARALMPLVCGQQPTHRDFQNKAATYRLAAYIESLRNKHGWPIETKMETAPTSDPVGRSATYARYLIKPENLVELRQLLGERLSKFIEAVMRFEGSKDKVKKEPQK